MLIDAYEGKYQRVEARALSNEFEHASFDDAKLRQWSSLLRYKETLNNARISQSIGLLLASDVAASSVQVEADFQFVVIHSISQFDLPRYLISLHFSALICTLIWWEAW